MGVIGISVGSLWGSYGATMGQPWAAVGHLWGSYGAPMGQPWGSYGAAVGLSRPPRPAEDAFPYEEQFQAQLGALRRTHTYRVFTAVGRRADAPPLGTRGTAPHTSVELWCSNDYLGLSRHPAVLRAARWGCDAQVWGWDT